MNRKRLIYALIFVTVVCLGIFIRHLFVQASHKARTVNQAVWIARMWDEKLSIEEICTEASRRSGVKISTTNWSKSSGRLLALGPIIEGRQISIDQDLAVRWITAHPDR